jgi:type II secretory pathway pseudopilin PulG
MDKKAQVWIETMIYTLIGIAVIGLLLAFAKPKIDEMKDKSIIQQTISSFNDLNNKIIEIQRKGPENSREYSIKLSKGSIIIDPSRNRISWLLDSSYKYSEPGYVISSGDLKINTTIKGSGYTLEIFKDLNVNLTFDNAYYKKELAQAPTPYTLLLKNNGVSQGSQLIDISVI